MNNFIFFFFLFFASISGLYAQIEMKFSDPRFYPNDINDSGVTVGTIFVYDFASNTQSRDETPNLLNITGITNDGSMSAQLLHPNSSEENGIIEQPGYKLAGQSEWVSIGYFPGDTPGPTDFSSSQGISANGRYITGLVSRNGFQGRMYLYDTTVDSLYDLHADELAENSSGYAVSNDGVVVGWIDPPPGGTLRIPTIASDGTYQTLVAEEDLDFIINTAEAITPDGKLVVGDFNARPFIFHVEEDSLQLFDILEGFSSMTFTDVSATGVCVGYAWDISDLSTLVREAIIYHPSLGDQPLFLRDFLENQGFSVPFDQTDVFVDGRMGTATAISNDGKFICGVGNVPNPAVSDIRSWVVFLDDLFVSTDNFPQANEAIKLYPNPGSQQIFFDCIQEEAWCQNISSVKVIDVMGRTVMQHPFASQINASSLTEGTYFIQFLDNRQRILGTTQWVKIRSSY